MAQESDVVDFSDQSFPKEIEVIPLPGHFFDMVGFRMPDNVVFLADCISSRETLDKYVVSFIYDVALIWKRWIKWSRWRRICSSQPMQMPLPM